MATSAPSLTERMTSEMKARREWVKDRCQCLSSKTTMDRWECPSRTWVWWVSSSTWWIKTRTWTLLLKTSRCLWTSWCRARWTPEEDSRWMVNKLCRWLKWCQAWWTHRCKHLSWETKCLPSSTSKWWASTWPHHSRYQKLSSRITMTELLARRHLLSEAFFGTSNKAHQPQEAYNY